MKEIARFYDAHEAKVAASFLRAEGYDVLLPDELTLGVQPELGFTLGGYRLVAADSDAILAKAALDERRAGSHQERCSTCGHTRFRRLRAWWVPALLASIFLTPFPFSPARGERVCTACGAKKRDVE